MGAIVNMFCSLTRETLFQISYYMFVYSMLSVCCVPVCFQNDQIHFLFIYLFIII